MAENGLIMGWKLAAVGLGLLAFGIGYNWLVARFQRKTQKYTAEMVVGGVLVTVLAAGLVVGWPAALAVLVCFTASGLPMVIGSWLRNAHDEEQARDAAKDLLK